MLACMSAGASFRKHSVAHARVHAFTASIAFVTRVVVVIVRVFVVVHDLVRLDCSKLPPRLHFGKAFQRRLLLRPVVIPVATVVVRQTAECQPLDRLGILFAHPSQPRFGHRNFVATVVRHKLTDTIIDG